MPKVLYQELTPNERGWLWCQRLGLWLGTWAGAIEVKPGTWLRFYDQQNNLVLLPKRMVEFSRASNLKLRVQFRRDMLRGAL